MKRTAWVICLPSGTPYWPSLRKQRNMATREYAKDTWRGLYQMGYRCKRVEVVE